MGLPYNKYIQFLRSSKKKRRQLACFVTALSVFVSGGVFWQLRGIGTAMVDENLPNADDSGEAITVTPLNASELETQDVWEATLPPLTDIAGENLARIAESQLGYSESSVNFVHAEDGETHNGYTRYGAWYGNPYGEWNTMFTYFCLNYAGVSSDDIPYGSGCWAWSLELDKAGLIVPVTRGSPARGDILLIDSDFDGKADRSCIVQSVSDDEISAVEGDIDGSVALTSYLIGDEQLLGMVSLADIVPEPTVLPDEPAEVDFSAESESGICVEAHADRDAFPPDTEMFVFDISQDEAVQAAADHFGDEAPDDIQAVAVDITFRSPDGEELEPAEDSQVRVSIVLPEEHSLTGGEFSLLHVSDDGDVQEVADASVSADGADFVAEEFSAYVLVSGNWVPAENLTLINGSHVANNSSTRYIVHVGDVIDVFMTGNNNIHVIDNNDNQLSSLDGFNQEPYTITYDGVTYNGIHRKYRADNNKPVTISNSVDSVFLNILDKNQQYFVWEGGNAVPANQLSFHGSVYPNSEDNPYIVYVGQEFDVFLNNGNSSYFKLPTNGEDDKRKLVPVGDPDYTASVTYNGSTINGCKRRFKAVKAGDVQCQSDNPTQSFYIRVIDPNPHYEEPHIFVKNELENKSLHRIKEFLNNFGFNNVDGYIPNTVGKEPTGDKGRPYAIRVGDTFEIYADALGSYNITNYELFYVGGNFDLKASNSAKIKKIPGASSYGDGTTSAKFQGLETGEVEIKFTTNDDKTASMWVRILPTTEAFNHADMEIADGGKYTITSTSYDDNGNKTTIIKVYNAYVTYINSAKLLDENGNPLALKVGEHNEFEFTSNGAINGAVIGDYKQIGEPGSTQYELTSAFGRPKQYDINDVKSAEFDVNITLKSHKQYTSVNDGPGTWEDLTGDDATIKNYKKVISIRLIHIFEYFYA